MREGLKGKLVVCGWCDKKFYKEPRKVKEINFCCPEHYRTYLGSDKNKTMSKGWKHSDEARKKIKQANLNRDYSKSFTEETRKKLADYARNRVITSEFREKMRKVNLGKKLSEGHKEKIRLKARYRADNNQWKDLDASYQAKHMYVYRHKAKPVFCIDCEVTSESKIIQWSNKDHLYSRNLEDYEGRCIPCHRRYDCEHGFVEPEGKAKRFYL